jgi:hypothetical protein
MGMCALDPFPFLSGHAFNVVPLAKPAIRLEMSLSL